MQNTRNESLETRIVAAIDDKKIYGSQGLNFINAKEPNKYDVYFLISILNSKLINYLFSTKYMNLAIKADYLKQIRFPEKNDKLRRILSEKAINMTSLFRKKKKNHKIKFNDLSQRYTSKNSLELRRIMEGSKFNNKIYSGRASKIRNFTVNINTNIITIYLDKSGSDKYEVLKFEEDNKFRRQYIKCYLENLTDEQLEEIDNKYSGNILKKTLRIEIPDYNKDHVVKKVVKEWENLQQKIIDLENEIERIDNEIDQMVYNLYDLTEEEIKIVENS